MTDRRKVPVEIHHHGRFTGVFPSVRTAANLLGLSEKKLSDVLTKRQRTTGDGYTARYWSGRAAHGGRGQNR